MTPRDFFSVYAADRRGNEVFGYETEQFPHLFCCTPRDKTREGLVTFANLTPKWVERQIFQQINYFEMVGVGFEWKVYEFDEPANLVGRLEAHGFKAHETEALLACPLDGIAAAVVEPGANFRVERVDSEAGLTDLIAIQSKVWGEDLSATHSDLKRAMELEPDAHSFFCAYDQANTVIGSGYIHYPRKSQFPELIGGVVDPSWRGHGVFRALSQARLLEARERFFNVVTTDATHMNFEVLQKMGFQMICHTRPLHKKAPPPKHAGD